jgi:hypothetical protein
VNKSFGERLLQVNPTSAHSLEQAEGRAGFFKDLDTVTAGILGRSLAGERIGAIAKQSGNDQLNLLAVTENERRFIRNTFLLSDQQKRGAWFLPEHCTIHIGNANLPYHYRRNARFASGVAYDERLKIDLRNGPEALYCWAVLEPLFDTLFQPITLRTTSALTGNRDAQSRAWQEVDSSFASLGVSVGDTLAVFRFGGGWSKLRASEQVEARTALLRRLASAVSAQTAVAFRMLRIQELVRRYYARAAHGCPTMRRVLTQPLQRTLSAYFGGDWLAFLRYIGEHALPEERIAEALPEAKLYVGVVDHAATVAEKHGIAPSEIEKMLRAFWVGGQEVSPLQHRVTVLRKYWYHFDDIHAKQAPGMPSLWGLVGEGGEVRCEAADGEPFGPAWFSRGCYRSLLPAELLHEIDTLWDGICLSGYPGSIVSAINPHSLMADTLGPALRFWHGAALTAWFLTEGPMSRTNMSDLAKYHARDLAELDALGCSINRQMFEDLIAAEVNLGVPRPMRDSEARQAVGDATLAMTLMAGSQRGGFEELRDVITLHRRAWTQRHFDAYLRARWEVEIRATAREFNRLFEQKGKGPTAKQFAKFAVAPANHWFGGNVSDLYASFGEKSPVLSQRSRLLPRDVQAFMGNVFHAIGGKPTSWNELAKTIVGNEREGQDRAWRDHEGRKRLAELSVLYVQLLEAIGAPPTLKEFGASRFVQLSTVLADQPEKAWLVYSQAIGRSLALATGRT